MILAGLILIITFLAAAPRFGITLFTLILLYKKKPIWFSLLWLDFISMAVITAFAETQRSWWICVKFLDISDKLFDLLVRWKVIKPTYLPDHTFKLFILAIILTLFYFIINVLYKKIIKIKENKKTEYTVNNVKENNKQKHFKSPEFNVDFAGSKEDFNKKYKNFI